MKCKIDDCEKFIAARGWCHTHYKRWQIHGDPEITLKPRGKMCKVEGCEKPHSSIGYCAMHEHRWRRYGRENNILNRFDSLEFAYDSQVIKNDGCWGWRGSITRAGYGQVIAVNKIEFIHRFSYQQHYGDLRVNDRVCHHCDNPICSNPRHLFKGTQKDNIQDCIRKGRFKKVPDIFKAKGEKVSSSKLKEQEVIEIKKMIAQGMKNTEIASLFGVTHGNISCIRLGKTWKHIK